MIILGLNTIIFLTQLYFAGIGLLFGQANIDSFQMFHTWGFIPMELTTGSPFRNAVLPMGITLHIATPLPTWCTILSSMFMHSSALHFVGNMAYLWVFGDNVEARLGHIKYALFYIICGLVASLCHWYFFKDSQVPLIGASGAISGILGAYFLLYPYNRIKVLIVFVLITALELQAMYVLGFYVLVQLYQLLYSFGVSQQTSVALWAHIGGFTSGLILIAVYKTLLGQPIWPRRSVTTSPKIMYWRGNKMD